MEGKGMHKFSPPSTSGFVEYNLIEGFGELKAIYTFSIKVERYLTLTFP